MDAQVDYYATLRVSPDADAAALRRAYRALMRRYHPDVNKDADAGARCHAINEAYDCLRDTAKRANYDAMRWVARNHTRQHPPQESHHRRTASPLNAFTPRYSVHFDDEPAVTRRGRMAAVVALGALVTLATFTATARVDWTPNPAASTGTREILMKANVGQGQATKR
nr:DnaJ domain-containing protein [uncultured Sphingomonas sp.]